MLTYRIKNKIYFYIRKFGFYVYSKSYTNNQTAKSLAISFLFLMFKKVFKNESKFLTIILNNVGLSNSQLFQDFLPEYCGINIDSQAGYFVEVGAGNGVKFSNTLFLENHGWTGILIEPNKTAFKKLRKIRSSILCDSACFDISGQFVKFTETREGEYSAFTSLYMNPLSNESKRSPVSSYLVRTITLDELFEQFNSPKIIDFLTIDTEGSEIQVINGINFKKYKFKIICIEMNYSKIKSEIINKKLQAEGYMQILKSLSSFDTWFIHGDYSMN